MSEQQQSSGRRRSRSGRRHKPARPFWGDRDTATGPEHLISPDAHPTALVDSLGPLPFPRADAAPHYFALVYQRSSGMAFALATAAGLVDFPTPDPEPNAAREHDDQTTDQRD